MGQRVWGLDTLVADLAAQTNAQVPEILRLFAEEATKDVRLNWPVKTGTTRDALTVTDHGGRIAIECDVRYASYIHEKGFVGPTYVVRIVEYVRQRADVYGARVAARIAEGT